VGVKCIVAWDERPAGDHAVAWAAARQSRGGRPLEIVRVLSTHREHGGEITPEDRVSARKRLHALLEDVRRTHPTIDVTGTVLEGDPVESLRLRARDGSLLVVGQDVDPRDQRHDRVASRLSALAAGPLVVVPPAHPAHAATGISAAAPPRGASAPATPADPSAASTPSRPHVVVGIDGTHAAIDALRFAADEARELGAQLIAVHVWAEPLTLDNVFVGSADLDRLLQHQHEELLEESIEVGLVDYPDVDVLRRVVRGRAAVELTRLSRDAQLLVVGDHGRGTIARHLLGSVSATLAGQPVVPTAIVHHPSVEPVAAAAYGRTQVEA